MSDDTILDMVATRIDAMTELLMKPDPPPEKAWRWSLRRRRLSTEITGKARPFKSPVQRRS